MEAELAARDARLAKLAARIAELERFLEQRTRDAKRQAAPFSKGPGSLSRRSPDASPARTTASRPVAPFPPRRRTK
jgi:hypothetical protein